MSYTSKYNIVSIFETAPTKYRAARSLWNGTIQVQYRPVKVGTAPTKYHAIRSLQHSAFRRESGRYRPSTTQDNTATRCHSMYDWPPDGRIKTHHGAANGRILGWLFHSILTKSSEESKSGVPFPTPIPTPTYVQRQAPKRQATV